MDISLYFLQGFRCSESTQLGQLAPANKPKYNFYICYIYQIVGFEADQHGRVDTV